MALSADNNSVIKLLKIKAWISAFRLRTLPLALASIGMGSFLAAAENKFRIDIVAWCILTTLFLQILSNLANDYGDTKHGADSIHRSGPKRAVQSGIISANEMKKGIFIFALLSLLSGLMLLWVSLGQEGFYLFILFLIIGLVAIWAAINYTAGSKPYGYAGLGDISVFIFFGLVGVAGTYFLQTHQFDTSILLPAASLGFFSTGVLNINNIRDIDSDKLAGKHSIPVRIGPTKARIYHTLLLLFGFSCTLLYLLNLPGTSYIQYLFFLTVPFLFYNVYRIWHLYTSSAIDPLLKQLSLTTLLFVLLFGISMVV